MKIVITGPKSVGKTTIGGKLANLLQVSFYDVDIELERLYSERCDTGSSCHDIFHSLGEEVFRYYELEAVKEIAAKDWCVVATGGSSLLQADARSLLRVSSIWVYLDSPAETLWKRIENRGLPAYLRDMEDPRTFFNKRYRGMQEVLHPFADRVICPDDLGIDEVVARVAGAVQEELAVRCATPNTFGEVIRLTTFGESHGPMIGAVLDGVLPGIPIDEEYISQEMIRRRPGQSRVSTSRKERDEVRIVSGLFEGKSTGAPIALLIRNIDSRSSAYEALREVFRPGHADFSFWKKYGIRDHRGGGRSSGRETACRVAGGAIARQVLERRGITIRAWSERIGDIVMDPLSREGNPDNPVRCPDPEAACLMEEAIEKARQDGDSLGGYIRVEVNGVPAGLGDPVFGKLDALLAGALFSIGAVKGVEIGSGFEAAGRTGSQNNDAFKDGEFLSNHAGGILGGISTGQPLIIGIAVKPTPSISREQETGDLNGNNRTISIKGRHDPCIVPRAIPVAEAMVALVIFDAWAKQDRIRPGWNKKDMKAI